MLRPPHARSSEAVVLRWRELPSVQEDLLGVCEALRAHPCPWLLDSALAQGRLGRYSFAGADPYLIARIVGRRIELHCRRGVRKGFSPGFRVEEADPFEWLGEILSPRTLEASSPPTPLPFVGGAVGYLGYELADQIEELDFPQRDGQDFPDATLLFVDRLVALDHETRRGFILGLGFGSDEGEAEAGARRAVAELGEELRPLRGPGDSPESDARGCLDLERRRQLLATPIPENLSVSLDRDGYLARIRHLKRQIAAGNVYEANLTQRMILPYAGDSWQLYRALRRLSPAPFASFMDLPDGVVLSSSPERFLRLAPAGEVESRPIKGTRPRGATAGEDRDLRRALATSEKDRAENLMIVDLVRNDLGRVCEVGSVEVSELMAIEEYSSVFQMVSTIRGQLREDRDALDLIRAAFPPGSMTGAPKIAATRLLAQLEGVRRGIYSGALGYFDLRGGMDLSVVIRTLLLQKDRARLHVGGAVVADSDPVAEYAESLDKARALLAALDSID